MTLKNSIEKLMRHENLTQVECQAALQEMLQANANPLQTAAFLVLLRAKTETADELAAFVQVFREKMLTVPTPYPVLDIVGTGGDHAGTINISTGSAILAASCGVKIAKHGNRAVSSLAGSADVLEALGVAIELSPEKVAACIDKIGIGFCYAPTFHPALRELRLLRKQLNIPTTLNILGPLLNPAHATYYVLGVYDEKLLPLIARTLAQTKIKHAVIAHGGGLDEISCLGPTHLIEITNNETKEIILDPQTLGLATCTLQALQGGDAKTNASILLQTFAGQKGPVADTLALNAAVALYVYGIYPSIQTGLQHAQENLASGAALTLLNEWKAFSHD